MTHTPAHAQVIDSKKRIAGAAIHFNPATHHTFAPLRSMSTPTQASYLATRPPRASEGARGGSLAPVKPEEEAAGGAALSSPSSPPSQWIVQKYGGTSVGKFLPVITSQIVPSYLASNPNFRLALVCSARSGSTKAKGTTNLLLKAADQALRPVGDKEVDSDLASSTAHLRFPSSSASSSASSSYSGFDSPALSASSSSAQSQPPPPLYEQTIQVLLEEHLSAVELAVPRDEDLRKRLEADVRGDCDRLRQFLYAAKVRRGGGKRKKEKIQWQADSSPLLPASPQIIEEISPRSQDVIMSLGERLSCRLICAALQDLGIPSELVGMESVIDPAFLEEVVERRRRGAATNAVPVGMDSDSALDQHFYDLLAEKMGEKCRAVNGVPVVTGYFGAVPGSLLSAVGRGYTDLCAALCAVGLSALELQIWKEVDGVFTADPRKVSTARLIPSITPEEAAELTYYGSEVIHPFTMEQAIRKKVPIRIKNVENPAGMGTVILPDSPEGEKDHLVEGHVTQPQTPMTSGMNTPQHSYPWTTTPGFLGLNAEAIAQLPGGMGPGGAAPVVGVVGGSASSGTGSPAPVARRLPTAVTIKEDVLVLNVHSNRKTLSHSFFSRIFSTLDRHGVAVDLISTSEVHVSMAISSASLKRPSHRTLEVICSELGVVGTVSVLRDMAILSLVGRQMRHMVGVAGKMFTTLAEGGINIEMISQGANEIK